MQKLSGPIDLIKRSFSIFFKRENLIYFLKIYSLLIPFSLFSLFQNNFITTQSAALNAGDPNLIISKYPWFLASVVVVNLLFVLVSFLVSIAGIKAVGTVLGATDGSVKGVYAYGWKNLWRFSLLAILVFLIILGGSILLIIPGIIFAIWFSFAKFVFVDQGLGIKASMSKSRELVKGRFWPVFGRMFVFGLFAALVGFVFSVVPFGIGTVLTSLAGALFILPLFLLYKELSA